MKRDCGPTWSEMVISSTAEVEGGSILKGSQGSPALERKSLPEGECQKSTKLVIESDLHKEIEPLQSREGSDIAMIRQLVKDKVEPSQESLTMRSEEFRKLAGMLSRMTIVDGILRVRLSIKDRPRSVIVCPIELRPVVIKESHMSTHAGINRTYRKVCLNWYWPGM